MVNGLLFNEIIILYSFNILCQLQTALRSRVVRVSSRARARERGVPADRGRRWRWLWWMRSEPARRLRDSLCCRVPPSQRESAICCRHCGPWKHWKHWGPWVFCMHYAFWCEPFQSSLASRTLSGTHSSSSPPTRFLTLIFLSSELYFYFFGAFCLWNSPEIYAL